MNPSTTHLIINYNLYCFHTFSFQPHFFNELTKDSKIGNKSQVKEKHSNPSLLRPVMLLLFYGDFTAQQTGSITLCQQDVSIHIVASICITLLLRWHSDKTTDVPPS